MKHMVAVAGALLFPILVFAACDRQPADPPAPSVSRVVVVHPQHGKIERSITLPGDLVGYYQSNLFAKVTGYLKSISVDKGDSVKAGQVLAVIEVPELKQQLARAQANLEIAQLTYQRLESVWKSDPRLVARQDVDIANSKYREAKANVDELATMVSYTQIIAPFDGIITQRFVDPGALIHAGGQEGAAITAQAPMSGGGASPVVSIARLDKVRIYVYVPQAEVNFVHRGMQATVSVQGLKGAAFNGTVTRFAHSLDLSTRTMLTEVDLENPQRTLYPGMYANVTLVLEKHPDALRLPATAIGGTKSPEVFVVKNGRLEQVPITTGLSNGQYFEVTSGLLPKDLVVKAFSDSLQQGERVNYQMAGSSEHSLALAK